MTPHFPKFLRMSDDFKPLGDAIKKPKPEKPDPYKEFEKLKHEHPPRKPSINEWPGSLRTPSDIAGDESFNAPASPTLKQTDGPSAGEPARQFKAGDTVRLLASQSMPDCWVGLLGTVKHQKPIGYQVSLNDGGSIEVGFLEDELELIEPASPPPSTGVLEPEMGKVYFGHDEFGCERYSRWAGHWMARCINADVALRSGAPAINDFTPIRLATPEELGA